MKQTGESDYTTVSVQGEISEKSWSRPHNSFVSAGLLLVVEYLCSLILLFLLKDVNTSTSMFMQRVNLSVTGLKYPEQPQGGDK